MTDLRDPFRVLDQVRPADLRATIEAKATNAPMPEPGISPSRRIVVIALALIVAAAAFGLVVAAFHGSSRPRPASPSPYSGPFTPGPIAYEVAQRWRSLRPNTLIYTVNADGSGRRLIAGPHPTAMEPTWSADGSKIAYVSSGSGSTALQIFVADAEGQDAHPITPPMTNRQVSRPYWSPDGTQIAYGRRNPREIVVVNADGSDPRVLSESDPRYLAKAYLVGWTPTGQVEVVAAPTGPVTFDPSTDKRSYLTLSRTMRCREDQYDFAADGVVFSEDGSTAACWRRAPGRPSVQLLVVMDLASGAMRHYPVGSSQEGDLGPHTIALAPDGSAAVVQGFFRLLRNQRGSGLSLIDLRGPSTGRVHGFDSGGVDAWWPAWGVAASAPPPGAPGG